MEFPRPAGRAFHHRLYGDGRGASGVEGRTTAVVLDSFSFTEVYRPYQGIPDAVRVGTAVPRGMRIFFINQVATQAKPLNDTHEILAGLTLSSNFAYLPQDFNARIVSDTAFDYQSRGYWEYVNTNGALPTGTIQHFPCPAVDITRIPSPSESTIISFEAGASPRAMIWPIVPPASPVLTFKISNIVAQAEAIGEFNAFATFLEYDLEQAQLFPINFPTPVSRGS